MKLVIQRVSSAEVRVEERVLGKIGGGLFVLVGVSDKDNKGVADYLAVKLSKLRILADETGKMNKSLLDVGFPVLVVSQFTLYADVSGGNRPSFVDAAKPELSKPLYEYFVNRLKELGLEVETGEFGSYMDIDLVLDGPVTIVMEK